MVAGTQSVAFMEHANPYEQTEWYNCTRCDGWAVYIDTEEDCYLCDDCGNTSAVMLTCKQYGQCKMGVCATDPY